MLLVFGQAEFSNLIFTIARGQALKIFFVKDKPIECSNHVGLGQIHLNYSRRGSKNNQNIELNIFHFNRPLRIEAVCKIVIVCVRPIR
jgi:hypothetical protein